MKIHHSTRPHQQRASSGASGEGMAPDDDNEFFASRPDRSFRIRAFSQIDMQNANSSGFYYGAPLPGMRRVVFVRQVYVGVFLYAVGQVNEDADLDMSECISHGMYMAVATPEAISVGNAIQALMQELNEHNENEQEGN